MKNQLKVDFDIVSEGTAEAMIQEIRLKHYIDNAPEMSAHPAQLTRIVKK